MRHPMRAGSAGATHALVLALLAACGGPPPPAPPLPPVAPPAEDTSALLETRPRHAVRPVPLPRAFERAVANGTRTLDGRPGPRYWQQRVEYRIDAELDPATARLNGVETIVYHNQSPDTLSTIVFHLYQNVFSEGVQRVRRVPITGGLVVERVAIGGAEARPAGAAAQPGRSTYTVDGTLMRLALPRPLPPGGRTEIEIAWHFTVPPRGAPRTGHDANQVFVVAQWYPQVATYDDLNGWHARPYWSNGEFYLEYGDFDVALTLPEGWLVTASGQLENPDEVLDANVLQRLARVNGSDDIVRVVTQDDVAAGAVTVREPGGQLTWRFAARDVRDFAFAASNRYVWDAARAVLPDAGADGRPDTVRVDALYRADAPNWRNAAAYTRHALGFHARNWHAYIYPRIGAAEGPIGGMEYPMLVFIGAPAQPIDLYAVLSHEVAHQWWSMMVGSNETLYAWQDEGLTTYVEDLSVAERFPGSEPAVQTRDAYLAIAGTDGERPSMREPDLYGIGSQYGIATYFKPATAFRALGAVIGDSTVHAGLRVYARRWLLKHPAPWDLFNTIEDVAGRELDWFWHSWLYTTATLDYAITAVDIASTATGERVRVTIEDQGEAPMPVPLVATFADGSIRRFTVPVEPWLDGRVRQRLVLDVPAGIRRIEIDAVLPDVDPGDNVWVR